MPSSIRSRSDSMQDAWSAIDQALQTNIPQVHSLVTNSGDFTELRLKARDDGTTLAILKAYAQDGTPMVAFGVGMSFSLSLIAVEATIAGGHWKRDKFHGSTWKPSEK